jgi:hypothetical protein
MFDFKAKDSRSSQLGCRFLQRLGISDNVHVYRTDDHDRVSHSSRAPTLFGGVLSFITV